MLYSIIIWQYEYETFILNKFILNKLFRIIYKIDYIMIKLLYNFIIIKMYKNKILFIRIMLANEIFY